MKFLIKAYEPSVCRSLGAHYVGESSYMGVKTAEFAIDIGSKKNTKQCYCRDEDSCPKKGIKLNPIFFFRIDFEFFYFYRYF